MPHDPKKPMPQRINRDGSTELICPVCYRTVLSTRDLRLLVEAEANHVCKNSSINSCTFSCDRVSVSQVQ